MSDRCKDCPLNGRTDKTCMAIRVDNGGPPLCDWIDVYRDSILKDAGLLAPKTVEPTLIQQAKTFGAALVGHAANGFRSVTPEVYAQRIATCNACEFLTVNRQCAKCACPVDVKARWASESCPLSEPKWGAVVEGKGCNCGK